MKDELVRLATSNLDHVKRLDVIEKLEELISKEQDWLLGHQLLIQLNLQSNNIDFVINQSEKLLNTHNEDPVLLALNAEASLMKGDITKAADLYQRAAKGAPKNISILYNLANTFRNLKQHAEAIVYYKQVLALDKKHVDALVNLGVTYQDSGNNKDAEKLFRQVNKLSPTLASAYINLAQIRYVSGEHKTAKLLIEHALTLKSITADARIWAETTLAGIALAEDKPEYGLNLLEKMYDRKKNDYYYLKTYLSAAQKYCLTNIQAQIGVKLAEYYDSEILKSKQEQLHDQFSLLACAEMQPELLLKSSLRKTQDLKKPKTVYQHQRVRKNKQLKIGYLTADFRDHPIAHLMLGVIKSHDRQKYEIYGYDLGPENYSLYRYKGIQYVDLYQNVHAKDASQIAKQIAEDEIDILIDLVGYTEFCQPRVLMHRPAPVQISYLGFVGTTGLEGLDYIIADKIVLPESEQPFYTEKPIYLPRCFQATDGTLEYKPLPRSEFGIPDGVFVFGSFNNSYKLNADFVSKASDILSKCPDSILWLYSNHELSQKNLIDAFSKKGIEHTRLYFYSRGSKARFLAALANIDLFLDSSPYNAGTTASDALYAGCPVLAEPGRSYSSRMSASILTSAGLPELVTNSREEFIAFAINYYEDSAKQLEIRTKAMNAKLSRLFDTVDAARCLEQAYEAAYQNFMLERCEAIDVQDPGWIQNQNTKIQYAGSFMTSVEVDELIKKIDKFKLGKKYFTNLKQSLKPINITPNSAQK